MAVEMILTVDVDQLMKSGCLSKVNLMLNKEEHQHQHQHQTPMSITDNDDNVSSQTHIATATANGEGIDLNNGNNNNGETIISMQHIRNAIKVSLLLTRTFAKENSYN